MNLRVGLIGCGDIGRLRAAAVRRSRVMRLAAVADLDETKTIDLASKHDVPHCAPEALMEREDVDAVIVSTPPSSHAEVGIAALRAGKHVLCEKPLARSVEECREMVDAAAQSGCLLATGFNYRFYPPVRKAEHYLRSGLIGELDHIRSYAGYSATELSHSWMREAEIMGGGALRDNGIHLIDLTCYFLGDVDEVKGYTTNAVWRLDGCEDNGFALLCSKEGKVASLQASWTEWRRYRFLLDIYGTLGCLRISCFPMYTQVYWSKERGGKTHSKLHVFPMTHIRERLQSYRRVVINSFVEELSAFARAVHGERTPLATGLDGLRAIDIAQQACESARDDTCAALAAKY